MNLDNINLTANGRTISGWTTIRIVQSMDMFPNHFELSMTEFFPDQLAALRVNPGDYCEMRSGKNIMVAGYIDRYFTSMSDGQHAIRLSGRGKCQDMLDCSAEWPGGQFSNVTVKDLAKNMAKAYGNNTVDPSQSHPIEVICDVPDLRRIKQLNLMIGESPYEVLDRVSRYSSVLVFENAEGNLVLARAGTEKMASGFEEGINVQSATIEYGADLRFSEYTAFISSMINGMDGGDAGNLLGGSRDSGVKRNRKMYIVAEATAGFQDICLQRATWERNHRNGQSEVIKLTTDSWRDSAGALWTTNKLVDVNLPTLKMEKPVTWLIKEVTFRRDPEKGTTADLTIVNPDAVSIRPMALEQSNLIDTSKLTVGSSGPVWDEI